MGGRIEERPDAPEGGAPSKARRVRAHGDSPDRHGAGGGRTTPRRARRSRGSVAVSFPASTTSFAWGPWLGAAWPGGSCSWVMGSGRHGGRRARRLVWAGGSATSTGGSRTGTASRWPRSSATASRLPGARRAAAARAAGGPAARVAAGGGALAAEATRSALQRGRSHCAAPRRRSCGGSRATAVDRWPRIVGQCGGCWPSGSPLTAWLT
jgi:hypothetical protein